MTEAETLLEIRDLVVRYPDALGETKGVGAVDGACLDIEPRLRKVVGYRHLPKLREALQRELKIEAKTSTVSKRKVA